MSKLSNRYSNESMIARRNKNKLKFLERANEKFGNKFDYSSAMFINQKTSLTIICPDHGDFETTPDKHLGAVTGCPKCGINSAGVKRNKKAKDEFHQIFETVFSKHLKLLNEYQSVYEPVRVQCQTCGVVDSVSPDNIKHQKKKLRNYCSNCSNTFNRTTAQQNKLEEIKAHAGQNFPGLNLSSSVYINMHTPMEFVCTYHGAQQRNPVEFLNSPRGCVQCARDELGWSGTRIRQLTSGDPKFLSRSTKLAVMSVEVFGIESLKVGITTRSLEQRYREALKIIWYSVELDELDALMLELLVKREFERHQDKRIYKAGMRAGDRWSGDTEIYWPTKKDEIISFIEARVSELTNDDENYWLKYQLEIPSEEPIAVNFEKSLVNLPKPVIGISPETMKVVVKFDCIADANRAGYKNVSMALSGHRNQSGGLLWFTEEEADSDTFKALLKDKLNALNMSVLSNGKPVRCKESGIHYHSTNQAAESIEKAGYKISPSHITSVCKSRRHHAGGFTWEYSSLTHHEIAIMDQPTSIPLPSVKGTNANKQVKVFKQKTGELVGIFDSQSEAARQLGLSGTGPISLAIKNRKTVKGYRFELTE